MQVSYIRVSSATDRQNTELQQDALLTAGVNKRHLYEDRASGACDDRPGLKECLAFLRPEDVQVVWKLDRLGRSLAHLIAIIRQLKERRIGFRSLTQAIDTTMSMGEFVFNLFGSLAQYERALIQERVHAGLAAAKRQGRRGGRPRKLGSGQDRTRNEVVVGRRSKCFRSRPIDRRASVDAGRLTTSIRTDKGELTHG